MFAPSRLPAGRRKLLDVGAGNFGFLYVAKERGWDVLGIEPSEQGKARAEALDIPFLCGTFSLETIAGRGSFDLIHLNCVLEHLLDPIAVVETSYEFLAPNGILSICVPNDFNPLQQAFIDSTDTRPWWVSPLQHINYFDTESLPRLLGNPAALSRLAEFQSAQGAGGGGEAVGLDLHLLEHADE